MADIHFRLQFSPAEIPNLARRYPSKEDDEALSAGKRIAAGRYQTEDFFRIFKCKTRNRGVSRPHQNKPEEIRDALRLAVLAQTDRSAVAVLLGLSGVQVPVASAILTAINPKRYTVIDFRALEALGIDTPDRSLPFYLRYLEYCRETAPRHNVCLRNFDRALWQWSIEQAVLKRQRRE